MSPAPLVVVGDVMLDLDVTGPVRRASPDAGVPVLEVDDVRIRPGGAGLAALLAARQGREVVLVTPVGSDATAQLLRTALAGRVRLCPLPLVGSTVCKVRVADPGGQRLRLDLGDGRAAPGWSDEAMDALLGAGAVLVSDYGRDSTGQPAIRRAISMAAERIPVVWDPHPRGAEPVIGCTMITPNAAEARATAADCGRVARGLAARWRAAVAVTLGDRGALLAQPGHRNRRVVPPSGADGSADLDPCGAGDRFAAAVALTLAGGGTPYAAVQSGVAEATAFVRDGGAGDWSEPATSADLLSLLIA